MGWADAQRAALAEEIHQLFLMKDHLTPAALLETPRLLDALGGGEPEEAFARLCSVADEHSQNRHLAALFASIGLSVHGGTREDRMNTFGQRLERRRSSRTVRRWADAGVALLADILTEGKVWDVPVISVNLTPTRLSILAEGGDLEDLRVTLSPPMPMREEADACHVEPLPLDSLDVELLWEGETGVTFTFHIQARPGTVRAFAYDRRWSLVTVRPKELLAEMWPGFMRE